MKALAGDSGTSLDRQQSFPRPPWQPYSACRPDTNGLFSVRYREGYPSVMLEKRPLQLNTEASRAETGASGSRRDAIDCGPCPRRAPPRETAFELHGQARVERPLATTRAQS